MSNDAQTPIETLAFFRTKRGGRWRNIEIGDLTPAELDALALELPEKGWDIAKFLARRLREMVEIEEEEPAP